MKNEKHMATREIEKMCLISVSPVVLRYELSSLQSWSKSPKTILEEECEFPVYICFPLACLNLSQVKRLDWLLLIKRELNKLQWFQHSIVVHELS